MEIFPLKTFEDSLMSLKHESRLELTQQIRKTS